MMNELRCIQMDCFYNDVGICACSSDYRAPDLGEDCPEYTED